MHRRALGGIREEVSKAGTFHSSSGHSPVSCPWPGIWVMTCTHFPDEKTRTVREQKTAHREVILLPSELSSLSVESASSRLQKYLDASETASSVVILYYWSVSEGLQNREHSWQVRILRGTNTVSATRSSPGPDLLFFFFLPPVFDSCVD